MEHHASRTHVSEERHTNNQNRERLITARDAAGLLRISLSWLAKARMRGDGPPYVKLGRSVRYGESALAEWTRLTHTIINERALEPGELLSHFTAIRRHRRKWSDHQNAEIMIVAGSRYQRNEPAVCAICRKSFTRRRSTARFCSPRCRQRAHRQPGYRESVSSKMPKRLASAMLDQLEVHATQVWGYVRLTRHLIPGP